MRGTFGDGCAALKALVPSRTQGTVEFDQVYAFNQEVGYWEDFLGHEGPKEMERGHPHFLGGSLTGGSDSFMSTIADHLLHDGPVPGMIENAERLADVSAAAAPVEFGDLADSAHPQVTDDGGVVYDRPPAVPRLDEHQLAAKAVKRGRGDYVRDYLPKEHPAHGTTGPSGHKPSPVIGGE